jgi:hypothetical protein
MPNFRFLLAALVSCAASIALADDVPTLNVNKSCRADVQAYAGTSTATQCLAQEQQARQTLVAQWTTFAPEARTTCRQMVTDVSGSESYVELLTCLQMAKQSGNMPKN